MRIHLRDMFWLTLMAAVLLAAWRYHTKKMHELIRANATLQQQVLTSENRILALRREAEALAALHSGARNELDRLWRDRNSPGVLGR